MRIAVSLDTYKFVDPDNLTAQVSSFAFTRGSLIKSEIAVVKNGRKIELDSGQDIEYYITSATDYSVLYAGGASASSFSLINSGVDAVYEGNISITSSALDSAFSSGTVLTALANFEIRIMGPALFQQSFEPVIATIHNANNP